MKLINRRTALKSSLALAGSLAARSPVCAALSPSPERRYKIGACDWSIGKQGDLAAFPLAKRIGLDGLQVSLGTAADGMKLRQAEVQRAFLAASRESGIAIASLAIGELNNIPYKSDPRTTEWVNDSVDTCRALGCRVVLLAFFANGDLKGDQAGINEVVKRLRAVAPKAERAGVILGIESWLSADEHMEMLKRVDSPAVQIYYDVANSHKMGYDIYREIRTLGKDHICEFHMKENSSLLGQGEIDFLKVREALDAIEYEGWLQIEAAQPAGQPLVESYVANCRFLKELFSARGPVSR